MRPVRKTRVTENVRARKRLRESISDDKMKLYRQVEKLYSDFINEIDKLEDSIFNDEHTRIIFKHIDSIKKSTGDIVDVVEDMFTADKYDGKYNTK